MSINILNDNYYYYAEPIGFGSFSTIFKGSDYNNNETIAIKKINKIIDKSHIDTEIKVMKSLTHTNIIKLYDVIYKSKKELYFVLEYCNGGDLSYYIEQGITTFDTKYFYEILDALEYLFKNDILHRDIKPQNILINNNSIKISDFGFAKSFEKNELITTFCGSPLYMAPEIILNREYTYMSDIWSLGVVLYELLVKEHPYKCDSRDDLWAKIKSNKMKINFDLIESNNKRKFIKSLLVFNPKERIMWVKLFSNINNYKSRSLSFDERNINISQSLHIPKRKCDYLSRSVCAHNKLEIVNYEDCKVISNSAPNKLGSFYMKKYINSKNSGGKSEHILGNSIPHSNSAIFSSYLDKSVSTLKGFFSN
tara:strand:+ start:242 stop:1339 length:1098 start_codon:yes stop_codon:yes gene_type:complete